MSAFSLDEGVPTPMDKAHFSFVSMLSDPLVVGEVLDQQRGGDYRSEDLHKHD